MSYNSVPPPEYQPPCEPGPNEGCIKKYLHLCHIHRPTTAAKTVLLPDTSPDITLPDGSPLMNPVTGKPVPAYQASSGPTSQFALPDEILEELGRHTRDLSLMETSESIEAQLQLAQILLGWSIEKRYSGRMYLVRATAILLRALIRRTVFPDITGYVPRAASEHPKSPTE